MNKRPGYILILVLVVLTVVAIYILPFSQGMAELGNEQRLIWETNSRFLAYKSFEPIAREEYQTRMAQDYSYLLLFDLSDQEPPFRVEARISFDEDEESTADATFNTITFINAKNNVTEYSFSP